MCADVILSNVAVRRQFRQKVEVAFPTNCCVTAARADVDPLPIRLWSSWQSDAADCGGFGLYVSNVRRGPDVDVRLVAE